METLKLSLQDDGDRFHFKVWSQGGSVTIESPCKAQGYHKIGLYNKL